ncbi:MAG: hypothetical protein AAB373_02045 [Patescibacteria group bacterium]
MKKGSFLMVIAVVLTLIVAGYTGYLMWQRSSVEAELNAATGGIADLSEGLLEGENDRLLKAIAAKETVNTIDEGLLKWSRIIRDVRITIPEDDDLPIVDVLSYSGAQDASISLNIKTLAGRENPYLDIAKLIKSFEESDMFVGSFVPSISGGSDERGDEILTFLLTTKYLPKDEFLELDESVNEILDDSFGIKDEEVVSEDPVGETVVR